MSNYALDFLHSVNFIILFVALNELKKYREVSEWLKEHAWKACIPRKGIEGSNPFLSTAFQKEVKKNIFNSCDEYLRSCDDRVEIHLPLIIPIHQLDKRTDENWNHN